jgi:hypothetical protein
MNALHLVGELLGTPALGSNTVFLIVAGVLVIAICRLALANRSSGSRTDLEFSLFVVVMIFLSPTCWSHYFVILLLPLAVLANRAMRGSTTSSLIFLVFFSVLAIPESFAWDVLPSVIRHFGARAGTALQLFPALSLLGIILWLSTLARKSPGDAETLEPGQQVG